MPPNVIYYSVSKKLTSSRITHFPRHVLSLKKLLRKLYFHAIRRRLINLLSIKNEEKVFFSVFLSLAIMTKLRLQNFPNTYFFKFHVYCGLSPENVSFENNTHTHVCVY